jgi:hypothetical protein
VPPSSALFDGEAQVQRTGARAMQGKQRGAGPILYFKGENLIVSDGQNYTTDL